jgi:hypothetical protein
MKIIATRDSVCAGDDGDAPHERSFSATESTALAIMLREISQCGYLPPIAGGNSTWIVEAPTPIAVVAQGNSNALVLPDAPDRVSDLPGYAAGCARLHFKYQLQLDPQALFVRLSGGAI